MAVFNAELSVEWGDCDEAGIVFYPNYFYWFDCTFQRMLRSRNLGQRQLRSQFGAQTPLIEAGANFNRPVRYDDVLQVEAEIVEWGGRKFRTSYRVVQGAHTVVQGHELRIWAIVVDGNLKGADIPDEFKKIMT
jgi:YbgC/YbaW family acyl-CoA thioester hydrolase